MTTETQQQIAREASKKVVRNYDKAIYKADWLYGIILSAIDQATEALQTDLALAIQMANIESKRANAAQPQRNEPTRNYEEYINGAT